MNHYHLRLFVLIILPYGLLMTSCEPQTSVRTVDVIAKPLDNEPVDGVDPDKNSPGKQPDLAGPLAPRAPLPEVEPQTKKELVLTTPLMMTGDYVGKTRVAFILDDSTSMSEEIEKVKIALTDLSTW